KNFLAQRGHRLTVRSQLSRDRYKFEAINGGKARFQGFGREGLENFDLILMDTGSYLGLGRSERTALENALKENAGGLLILPEGPLFTGGSTPFRFQREGSTVFDLAPGSPGLEKYPYAFGQGFPLQAITVDGAAVAAYLPLESGRVATTLVRDSYQLILKGEGERYAALWTRIMDATVPGKGAWAQWEALTPLPRVDAPFGFKIWTPMEEPLVKSGDGALIPLIQDLAAPELWQGRLYPKKAGWNTLELPGDSLSLYSLYVFDSGQRTAMGLSGRLDANTARFARACSFGPMGETLEKRPLPLS